MNTDVSITENVKVRKTEIELQDLVVSLESLTLYQKSNLFDM